MRNLAPGLLSLLVGATMLAAAASAASHAATLHYTILRNGAPIGTSTMHFVRNGTWTAVKITTRVVVKIGFVTLYRYKQREIEQWDGSNLASMTSTTDDNGKLHHVSAVRTDAGLRVIADGRISTVGPAVAPISLWNISLVTQPLALDSQDGNLMSVSVVDRGDERLVVKAASVLAHHYSIKANLTEDVWYDRRSRLVKVELRGRDGSDIQYRPG